MNRLHRTLCLLVIGLMVVSAGFGTYFLLAKNSGSASAAVDNAVSQIRLASTRDFIYASHPQCRTDDTVLVTAQLYKDGQPVKKAGIPVDFSLSDGRFATLDQNRVYTDEWGTASTNLRSYASGQLIPTHPYLLSVTAASQGKTSLLTMLVTRYKTINGTVTDKKGQPVQDATVSLLYNATHNPISAMGGTTTTNIDGMYRLDRVPTDVGGVTIYVKKGDFESYIPANISS